MVTVNKTKLKSEGDWSDELRFEFIISTEDVKWESNMSGKGVKRGSRG